MNGVTPQHSCWLFQLVHGNGEELLDDWEGLPDDFEELLDDLDELDEEEEEDELQQQPTTNR